MNFVVNSTIFKQALHVVKGAWSNNQNGPAILRCVKFEMHEGALRLMCTDTNLEIVHDVDVEWESVPTENASYGIPGEEIFRLFDLLPEDTRVNIDIDPVIFNITVSLAFGEYEMMGQNGEHFPNPIYEIVKKDAKETVAFDLSRFHAGTDFVKDTTSKDLSRPGMNYVLLDSKNPCAVATTGTRIAKYDFGNPLVELQQSLMIDPKIIENIVSSNSTMSCNVTYDKQRISFAFGNTKVSGLTTSANFPKYQSIFEKDVSATGRFNRQDMIRALRIVRAFYNESRLITLSASDDDMLCKISATDMDSGNNAETSIDMNIDGSFSVMFNADILRDTINVFDTDTLLIKAADPGPYFIGLPESDHMISAIMPIS